MNKNVLVSYQYRKYDNTDGTGYQCFIIDGTISDCKDIQVLVDNLKEKYNYKL